MFRTATATLKGQLEKTLNGLASSRIHVGNAGTLSYEGLPPSFDPLCNTFHRFGVDGQAVMLANIALRTELLKRDVASYLEYFPLTYDLYAWLKTLCIDLDQQLQVADTETLPDSERTWQVMDTVRSCVRERGKR